MIYRFSELKNELKTKTAFDGWVDSKTEEIKERAFTRGEIYKNELYNELRQFGTLKLAWNGMNGLLAKSQKIDLIIIINDKGYHDFKVVFPITEKQRAEIVDARREWCKENDVPLSCSYLSEWYWNCLKDEIKSNFSFVKFHEGDYCVEITDNPLIVKVPIGEFK